jgi:hypothetical protein
MTKVISKEYVSKELQKVIDFMDEHNFMRAKDEIKQLQETCAPSSDTLEGKEVQREVEVSKTS